ncbi:Tea1p NDAI_0E03850 [Naumovozyma dairenensis CBS 421]|uniref:Zn(2)-C6 fungal-type domain-containing protein n=1 Tax=Naumovozyma dairenensis (strain ATCC 10597 / BCRC 20456 / CBS 421 / NBRC 0211 / NRRL Y-12639) TaxID=1071378 RepID=G0WBT2_NAUDC|nr:hypothetical protein NDAI_0E03850 [Naumovozyma dairenensis CBS 421]CCD25202.1 hypothetical protein NDAI_0E03850 [Naumovozyma dairenensis CBS 421]
MNVNMTQQQQGSSNAQEAGNNGSIDTVTSTDNEGPNDNVESNAQLFGQLGLPKRKRLACTNCRKRRKKCDLSYPCASCVRLRIDCNVNEEDLRKKRYSSSYVKSLEGHVAYLESNLKTLIDKVYPNNIDMLNSMNIGDVISGLVNNKPEYNKDTLNGFSKLNNKDSITTDGSISKPPHSALSPNGAKSVPNPIVPYRIRSPPLEPEKKRKPLIKGSLYPEGPVIYKPKATNSVLSVSSLVSNNSSPSDDITPSFHQTPKDGNNCDNVDIESDKQRISDLHTTVIKRTAPVGDTNSLNNDSKILESLSNFYKFLYPGHFIFVHRESFLYGFFNHFKNNYADSHYCSLELIYAMSAIGSRLSPTLQDMSEIYYEMSKTTLLNIVFDENSAPKITTVQALLCLAFYELGKGSNQLAWYFSGLAIRVGYDMGFQLDPQVWYTDDIKSKLTESELKIRSRIYWGCYIADHFICLMLGRTSTLSVSNSTIPESDELPEVNGTEEFRFVSKHVLQISLPLKNLIVLSRVVQIFTSKIFIETDDIEQKVEYLNNFNLQVFNWRQSLPDFLKWNKNLLEDEDVSTDPTISYFWYYYYIVRLTFNKPFIEDCTESQIVVIEILDDLQTLFNNFKKKYGGFNKATLYQLYVCLLAINCLKKLEEQTNVTANSTVSGEIMNPINETSTIDKATRLKLDEQLKFFNNIFYRCLTPAYQLPRKLQEDTDYEFEQEKQDLIQMSSNTNYIHDFSLSNEIDDLIRDLFGAVPNPNLPNNGNPIS